MLRRSAICSTDAELSTYSRSQETGTFIESELGGESEVVLPELAQVGQPVAEDRNPLETPAEREAGPLLGVVADELEQLRVDDPGAADLDPAGVAADGAALAVAEEARDVGLDRRLGEGEEVRREADVAILPEERAHQVGERALQVGQRDSAIDGEALDLVEDRCVRRVRGVAPVDAAGGDHVDRRLALLHRADLGRRGLGAKDDVAVQEERVQRRAGRVALRHVERVEVVVRGLDLSAVDDHVAQPEEDVLDLPPDLRDQVQVAAPGALTRQRDVDALLREAAVELGALERRLTSLDRLLDRLARRVQRLTGLAVPDRSKGLLELALPPQVANAELVQPGGVRSALNRAQSLGFQRLRIHAPTVPTATPVPLPAVSPIPGAGRLPPSGPNLSAKFARRCADGESTSRRGEPVRRHRRALRPLEPQRRRGRRLLRRGGAPRPPAGGGARRRHGSGRD